jgi:uncharacterized protein HemY
MKKPASLRTNPRTSLIRTVIINIIRLILVWGLCVLVLLVFGMSGYHMEG